MSQSDLPQLHLPLTSQQLEALNKTVGIAVNNLLSKSNRVAGHPSGVAASVNAELLTMLEIQQEVTDLIIDTAEGRA